MVAASVALTARIARIKCSAASASATVTERRQRLTAATTRCIGGRRSRIGTGTGIAGLEARPPPATAAGLRASACAPLIVTRGRRRRRRASVNRRRVTQRLTIRDPTRGCSTRTASTPSPTPTAAWRLARPLTPRKLIGWYPHSYLTENIDPYGSPKKAATKYNFFMWDHLEDMRV